MQKRLLALVATVAMVLSMFAGIAFAVEPVYVVTFGGADVKSTLDATPKQFALEKGSATVTLATVTKDGADIKGAVDVQLVSEDGTETADDLLAAIDTTGLKSIRVYDGDTLISELPVAKLVLTSENSIITTGDQAGLYYFRGELQDKTNGKKLNYTEGKVTGGTFLDIQNTHGAPEVFTATLGNTVTYYRRALVELDKTSIKFDAAKPVVITGTVRDANGNPLKRALIDSSAIALADATIGAHSSADGSFVLVLTNWASGGNKALTMAGVPTATVKIGDVSALSIKSSKTAGIYYNVPNRLVFNVGGPANQTVTLTLSGDATLITELENAITGFDGTHKKSVVLDANGAAEIIAVTEFSKSGSVTLTASLSNHTAAEVTLKVVKGSTGVHAAIRTTELEEITVGSHTISVGPNGDFEVLNIAADGSVAAGTITYSVWVNGVQLLDRVQDDDFTLTAGTLGTKDVRIAAFVDGVKKFDKTYTVKVKGWDVEYDVKTMRVNETKNIVFVIKDADGKAINNAQIYIDGTLAVNPATVNIQDGTYTVKNRKYTAVGTHNIEVKNGKGELMASFDPGINVLGNIVYDITADVEELLLGAQQTVLLEVTNAGTPFLPARVWVQVGDEAPQVVTATTSGNSVKVTVTPTKLKDITFRAGTFAGDKIAEVIVPVVAPKLVVLDDNNNITENVNSVVKFQIVDPRDDSVLAEEVTLTPVNFTELAVKSGDGKYVLTNTLDAAEEQEVMLLASDIDREIGAPVVEVRIQLDAANPVKVAGNFKVEEAVLTSTPEALVFGQASNVTLTYTDANGNPLAGKKVYLGTNASGTEIGKTDNEGKVVYVSAASGAVTFAATTNVTGEFTTVSVPVGFDNEAPVVSAPETVNKGTAVITISDNVRVTRLMVNGEEITIIPRQEVKHVVNVKAGKNVFDIIAIDNNYNVAEETVVINYVDESVVLKGEQVKRQGEFVFVQVRQFEELGAQVGWKQDTQTATFIVGDTKVEVTIGSLTAKVNGKAVTMPAAPFIDKATSRTFVPTRFIAEALNWNVHWAAGDVITITLP